MDNFDFQTRLNSLMADLTLYKEALVHGQILIELLEEEVGRDDRSTPKIRALLVSLKLTSISSLEGLGEEIDLILGHQGD